ncbi:MAG: cytochrome P450 [Sciscionella sp.]
MGTVRSKITGWLARKYLARKQRNGFDLASMSFLPEAALMPLRRSGLDPVVELREVREREPVSKIPLPFGMTAWLVSGYDEAKQVLGKATGFSNDFSNLIGSGFSAEQNPGGLGFADPPVHTRLRKLLTPEFTMRRLSRLTPRIQAIVDGQLDMMAEQQGDVVDLVGSFALPIPSLSICELLGVPYADRAEFQRLSMTRFDLFGGTGASLDAISESLSYLREVVAKQRKSPGDGLLGMLVAEHGDAIDDEELAGLADGLLTGGLETTASMLALGAITLLRDPHWFRVLGSEDESITPFVEELLRYLTVVQVAFPRFAREEIEVGDVTIASGDIVICSLSGANRDASLGAGIEQFDPTRAPSGHLAFGYGIHRCVGAELARMELRVAYPSLVRRFPRMSLAVDAQDLDYRKLSIVYGVESLPVALG